MIEERATTSRPIGLFMIAALFLLFAALLASGGLYFYKGVLIKNIAEMDKNLKLASNRFEPAKISELQQLNKRLTASNEILSKHIAISPIFKALQDITLKTIRYTQFSYNLGEGASPKVLVKMSGIAVGYRSIALQSDLFTKNKNLIDPVFSSLVLDDKGNVVFNLDFSVDPAFVDYKHIISIEPTT